MIYSRSGWNGGKLAYLLGCSVTFPHGNEDRTHAWTKNKERRGRLPRNINLGCRKKFLPQTETEATCLNINSYFSSDKVKTFQAFDKEGIPHPRLISVQDIQRGNAPAEFLGRKNGSFAGRGIVKYTPESWKKASKRLGFKGHDFYVEFLHFKAEYRIHVFMGQTLCELNKIVKPNSTNFIHTLEQGSPLEIGPIIHPQKGKMVDYAIKAIKACKLDFGAVDLFVDQNDNIYVLEVNSDPGMPGIIGFLYAEAIRRQFNLEVPDYYYNNSKGGVTEVEEPLFFRPHAFKRKKLNVKSEDFSYKNEGVKMKQ